MSDHPFLTVIMPAHNAAAYIVKGLNSVRSQSFRDYELIVICDACTDHTKEIARQYTDRVFETDNHSPGPTRNMGLDHARGEYVIFIDDDDWFLHEYVFQQIADRLREKKADMLNFAWIWKGKGYIRNGEDDRRSQVCGHVWRRGFIGDTRFPDQRYMEDYQFYSDLMRKDPVTDYWDMPMYYYNYGRVGSLCWHHYGGREGLRLAREGEHE